MQAPTITPVSKDEARREVEAIKPILGFFQDQRLGGDAFPKHSVLQLIDEADEVYWDHEATPALLVVRLGEEHLYFDLESEKHSIYRQWLPEGVEKLQDLWH